MKGKARTIDEDLESQPKEKRDELEILREVIRQAAPEAEECISYWPGNL